MNLRRELADFWFYLRRLLLARIPSVSALAALLVAAWVGSAFHTSPTRDFAVRAGWVRDSRHYVSSMTYKTLAIALPLITAAGTAYGVQRFLRRRRARFLERDRIIVARRPHLLTEAKRREALLDEALKLGLLTAAEHDVKCADLYAWYARDGGSVIAKAITMKLT